VRQVMSASDGMLLLILLVSSQLSLARRHTAAVYFAKWPQRLLRVPASSSVESARSVAGVSARDAAGCRLLPMRARGTRTLCSAWRSVWVMVMRCMADSVLRDFPLLSLGLQLWCVEPGT
jgi:hypothetical protein